MSVPVEIHTSDTLIAASSAWPLDLEEVKKARRFYPTSLDTLFDLWMQAAVQEYEEMTSRHLLTTTREYVLDGFPDDRAIELPRAPLLAVTSVTYDGTAGVDTLASSAYVVTAPTGVHPGRGRIALIANASWPTTADQGGAVRIRYQVGYGPVSNDVPAIVKYALLMLIGHFHRYGEDIQDAKLAPLPIGASSVMRASRLANVSVLRPVRLV